MVYKPCYSRPMDSCQDDNYGIPQDLEGGALGGLCLVNEREDADPPGIRCGEYQQTEDGSLKQSMLRAQEIVGREVQLFGSLSHLGRVINRWNVYSMNRNAKTLDSLFQSTQGKGMDPLRKWVDQRIVQSGKRRKVANFDMANAMNSLPKIDYEAYRFLIQLIKEKEEKLEVEVFSTFFTDVEFQQTTVDGLFPVSATFRISNQRIKNFVPVTGEFNVFVEIGDSETYEVPITNVTKSKDGKEHKLIIKLPKVSELAARATTNQRQKIRLFFKLDNWPLTKVSKQKIDIAIKALANKDTMARVDSSNRAYRRPRF